MDLLTDVLERLRLQGTVYFQADFAAPWGMDFAGGEVANFHLVVGGECWVWTERAGPPRRLCSGDLVVFPHGAAHRLADRPDGDALPARTLIDETGREQSGRLVYGGDGGTVTTLVCGHFDVERAGHPMWDALPDSIHLARQDQHTDWIETAARMSALEISRGAPGARAVVDRLAEVMLIQVVRAYVDAIADRPGFLAAMSDASLGRALAAIHEQPAHDWSVGELAGEAGLSRSAFSDTFNRAVGMPPMRYVTHWRMLCARDLLVDTDLTIAAVAEQVGYESEFSFAKAFKRTFGDAPGAVRRERRTG